MRRALAAGVATIALFASLAPAALATSTGTRGQPNQDCESLGVGPAGFKTAGFDHATSVYAGSGPGSAHANSDHAVSQYDVACFQMSSH